MRDEPFKRLKIAVLTRHFSPKAGGAERYAMALVSAMCRHHEVHVFAQRVEFAPDGVHYHLIGEPLKRPRWMNQWWYAYKTWQLTRVGFDVVHSHENTWHGQVQSVHVRPAWLSLLAAAQASKGFTAWIKTGWRYLGLLISPRRMSYLWLEHRRLHPKFGKQVVSVSKSLEHELQVRFGLDAAHLSTVSPGVDDTTDWIRAQGLERMSQAQLKRHARERLGLNPDRTWLLWVGNDARKKGLVTLLNALNSLPSHVHLMVVGQARHADKVLRPFKAGGVSKGLESRLQFLGSLPDVSMAYLASDVLVHPTLEDTFGMVVLEAMSWARPVCVSEAKFCGIAAHLHHQDNAYVFEDPLDSAALVRGIEWVLQADNFERVANAGLKWSKTQNWASKAQAVEAIYLKSRDLKASVVFQSTQA